MNGELNEEQAWQLEQRLWLEGAAAYRELLDPHCVMAFAGVGVMRADAILASVEAAPRWHSVDIGERCFARPGDDLVVLGYRAAGRREGGAPYLAFCTSTYRRDKGRWRLVQHQQTPETDPGGADRH